MKTNEIADIIMRSLQERNFMIYATSISVDGLAEMDVVGINRNEYTYEFEIKRSRSDFKADFKKTYKHYKLQNKLHTKNYNKWIKGKKTDIIERSIQIPNRFYYVCEEGLIKLDEIPKYAGLIYIKNKRDYVEIKNAPLLHREKVTKAMYKGISGIFSQRFVYGCSYLNYINNQKLKL